MPDIVKIQKLLNLTASANDAEALAALRMAQKALDRNLGDYLASEGLGPSPAAQRADELYAELERLFELESAKVDLLRKQLDQKEKQLRKLQRDVQNLKRDLSHEEVKREGYERTIDELSERLLQLKVHR